MREIHLARRGLAGSFLGTRAGEKRAMEHGHLHFSGMIGYGDGEEAGILVVHVDEIDPVVRLEGREPQPLPVDQIVRYGESDPRADGRKGRVGHHVAMQRLHECDARIFAATAAVRQPLVVGLRLQCDAEPLDPTRIAGVIEANPRDADARIIASCDETGKKIKLTIRTANGSRIQDALDFLRITRFRLHDLPEPLHSKAVHRLSSLLRSGGPSQSKQAMIASITRFDSSGSLTWMDAAPASSAG